MNKSYRLRTDIGTNSVLRVNLSQDFDFLEILSLKINQEDTYRLDNSNYGIIVGRVLANDAFGIPNAKISIFIPIEDDDKLRTDITNLYSYTSTSDKNSNNIRYNLLPDSSNDDCYRVVGTFPNKRLVLDDNVVLEVFDKYYKYTTVTNNAGDYMIYGVPTGNTQLHVDLDLSDIGILSQKPRDFIYKGYTETQFDNSEQFKESTNLDNLAQILSQDQSVYVYPFFSEEGSEDAAITRCDVQIQYKFEPTCVFFGAIVSDSFSNNIQPTCTPNKNIGRNSELVCGEGTIEMIRKTVDGLVEEFPIQGNQLIDGNGVWCYQIPMNLDYVGTDEFGNIVATDNPNKGIPTRTRVRFRFSMTETESDSVSRHRAKYLVPNNPDIIHEEAIPSISACSSFDKHYEFGSATLDEDFRDLYWNKVYSVKNYIPRLQTVKKINTLNYSGIRTTNKNEGTNPFPFNKARYRLLFSYRLLCVIVKVVIVFMMIINGFFCSFTAILKPFFKVPIIGKPFKKLAKIFGCIPFGSSLIDTDESNVVYYPGCWCHVYRDCPEEVPNCEKDGDTDDLYDIAEQALAQEYDIVNLDFYNDWINGSLYMPLWHWKKTKKRSYFFGLFRKKAKNSYCDCDKQWGRLRIMDSCTIGYRGSKNDDGRNWHNKKKEYYTKWGMVKNVENKDGLNIYYYSAGVIVDPKPNENPKSGESKPFARYYATDIILLGSFNSCDTEGLPQPYLNLPSTTANIPEFARVVMPLVDEETSASEGTEEEEGLVEITGMDWLHKPTKSDPKYGKGLLFGIDCNSIETKPKSCVNLLRLCELGVNRDMTYKETYAVNPMLTAETQSNADGVISKIELDDYETRAMFATLNHYGLTKLKTDPSTGYKIYDLRYIYPVDFDGRHNDAILRTYKINEKDNVDNDYLLFKYGDDFNNGVIHNYTTPNNVKTYTENDYYPYYNNSFYFYFGLNEGKTAIDMFRKKYTSTCFKNIKYPFTIDVNTITPKWCIYTDGNVDLSKTGVIDVNLPNIKKPYSYSLSVQSTGDIVISESNVNMDKLVFGVKLTNRETYEYGSGSTEQMVDNPMYYQSEDGKFYVKDGKVHFFEDYPYVVNYSEAGSDSIYEKGDDGENTYYLENISYNLTITDVNGNTEIVAISLNQQAISMQSETSPLGAKFIPQEQEGGECTTKEEIYDNDNYGEIRISAVTIDGDDYKITNCVYHPAETGQELILHLSGETYEYDARLLIRVRSLAFPNDIRFSGETLQFLGDCCDGTISDGADLANPSARPKYNGTLDTAGLDGDGIMFFYPWIPGIYDFVLTQYCNGELNDNMATLSFRIENGNLFDAFLNDVPMRFLPDTSNGANADFWYNVNNPSYYNFPNISNEAIWSEYVDYMTTVDEEYDTETLTQATKAEVLMFKFMSLFKISDTTFFTDDGNNSFDFQVSGGKNSVNQVFYPTYGSFVDLLYNETNNVMNAINFSDSKLNRWTLDTNALVSCDELHPNIIAYNYKAYFYSINGNSNSNDQYYGLNGDSQYGGQVFFNKTDLIPYSPILGANTSDSGHGFNTLFFGNNQDVLKTNAGNYYAAFTNNAGLPSGTKYKAFPSNARPITNGGALSTFESQTIPASLYYYTHLKDWFKTYFVDMRMGFRGVVMTSSPSLANIVADGTDDPITRGRLTLQTIGGIEMAYSDLMDNSGYTVDDNVIQRIDDDEEPLLEYYYKTEDLITEGADVVPYLNQDFENMRRYFYTASLIANGLEYDLRHALYNKSYTGEEPFGVIHRNDLYTDEWSAGQTSFSGVGLNSCIPTVYSNFYNEYYNGEETYPIKRFTDVIGINFNGINTLRLASTSYNINVASYYEDDDSVTINGITAPTGEIELQFDSNSIYRYASNDISSCVENGNFEVLSFGASAGGNSVRFTPKYLRLSVAFGEDYIYDSTEYTYATYRPMLLTFNSQENLVDFVRKYKLENQTAYAPFDTYEQVYMASLFGEYGSSLQKMLGVEAS